MKCRVFIIILISISTLAFSQDYLDEIALKACGCINTVSDTLAPKKFNLELGLCIINAAIPYKKELKKDFNIDLNIADSQVDELGQIIGLRMKTVCPDTLKIIFNKMKINEQRIPKTVLLSNNLVFADKSYEEDNYTKAIIYYEECNKIDSTLGIVNYRLGVCYLKLFIFDKSTAYFRKSIALEYRKGDALFNIALIFSSQQKNDLALDYFEKALIESPDDKYIQLQIDELKALNKL